MIKHIVMWKLKESAEGADKKANALKIKQSLNNLVGKIQEIKLLEVGVDILKSEASFDVVLVSEFETMETLKAYQAHPEHVAVAGFIGKVVEKRVVIDYEFSA